MKSRHLLGPTFPCPKNQPYIGFGRDLDQSNELDETRRLVQVPSKTTDGLIFGARKGGSQEVAALHFLHQYTPFFAALARGRRPLQLSRGGRSMYPP